MLCSKQHEIVRAQVNCVHRIPWSRKQGYTVVVVVVGASVVVVVAAVVVATVVVATVEVVVDVGGIDTTTFRYLGSYSPFDMVSLLRR